MQSLNAWTERENVGMNGLDGKGDGKGGLDEQAATPFISRPRRESDQRGLFRVP